MEHRLVILTARHSYLAASLLLCVSGAFLLRPAVLAQEDRSLTPSIVITIDGTIRDASGNTVSGATVFLEETSGARPVETTSNADGTFRLTWNKAGTYAIGAQKAGVGNAAVGATRLELAEAKRCDLVLLRAGPSVASQGSARSSSPASTPSSGSSSAAPKFEFNDEPNFTVAGVTDWSNAGLHGSDARAKTNDALTKEAAALRTGDLNKAAGGSSNAAYDLALEYRAKGDFLRAREEAHKSLAGSDTAEVHHLLGDLDERLGEFLEAVREFERAARMDPSEGNYFDWGAELLLHKAAQPAAEVFSKGSSSYPKSSRLLAGLGVALYAAGSYDEATARLCAASDLSPVDPVPYLLLGEIEKSSAAALSCSEERLARFVQQQPRNALANYYYAVVLWKGDRESQKQARSEQVKALLEAAIDFDPKLSEAYVQLGIVQAAHGDFASAIETYRKALAVDPNLSDAHYRLGLAYKRTGEDAKARKEFDAYRQAQKSEIANTERQRRELKQFSIIFKNQGTGSATPGSQPH